MNTDRWLITGGTGFIGGAVVRQAVNSGIHVAVLVRDPSRESLPEGVVQIAGELASPDWHAIRAFEPQLCIHSAWISTPGVYLHSPENGPLADASLRFAKDLYQLGLSRFVGLGTCLEYASSPEALHEMDSRSTERSPYVDAKLRTLDGLVKLAPGPSSYAWVRVFYPYGQGEPPQKFLSSALRTLSEGGELSLRRPADVVDYIHVTDTAAAICAVARARDGGIFNIGTGHPLTVTQVANTVRDVCGGKGAIIENAQDDPTSRYADTARLKVLGWKPSIPLEEGIRSMLTTYE